MLKGYERKLIMIRTKDSSFFESAFFILRSDACKYKGNRPKMVEEANRILRESKTEKRKRILNVRYILLLFGIGFLVGCAFGAGTCFLFLV